MKLSYSLVLVLIGLSLTPFAIAESKTSENIKAILAAGDIFPSGKELEKIRANAQKKFDDTLRLAQKGDKKAQYDLARMYVLPFNLDIETDYKKAFEWKLKSAEQGYLPAILSVASEYGLFFGHPRVVDIDDAKAFYWYQKAAQQGDRLGLYAVASAYASGDGVKQDIIKAESMFKQLQQIKTDEYAKKATEQLYFLYKKHYPERKAQILQLLEEAYPNAIVVKSLLRDDLIKAYSEGVLTAKNDAKVFPLLLEKKNDGDLNAEGFYRLALMYEGGLGTAKNQKEADALFERLIAAKYFPAILHKIRKENLPLAEKGNATAQLELGYAYLELAKATKSPQDKQQGLMWINKAAQQNDVRALALLASINGKSPSEVVQFVMSRAKAGEAEAQYMLGKYYFEGVGDLGKDYQKSLEWFAAAAKQRHPMGIYEMGHMYDHGHGVDINKQLAKSWYEKALKLGVDQAQIALNRLNK
ncbi:tetratricopeptide repeat protein [Acinetobacter faecalis]|uniref:Tetratricopeptide repeat protein n=1 Tax=Acinetobacter faecalis TaxID=2665161 RepID=A0AB35UTH7_9GAMM|nr:tetratricopeptide repeat protein [Acinetobacter faecalis]MDY6485710.1 tetratricopeptide repeat protein [Acinetobacter faecalis]